jgi:hypothetical protein
MIPQLIIAHTPTELDLYSFSWKKQLGFYSIKIETKSTKIILNFNLLKEHFPGLLKIA